MRAVIRITRLTMYYNDDVIKKNQGSKIKNENICLISRRATAAAAANDLVWRERENHSSDAIGAYIGIYCRWGAFIFNSWKNLETSLEIEMTYKNFKKG